MHFVVHIQIHSIHGWWIWVLQILLVNNSFTSFDWLKRDSRCTSLNNDLLILLNRTNTANWSAAHKQASEAHREAIVDVFCAGLGHTCIWKVHFIKNKRLQMKQRKYQINFVPFNQVNRHTWSPLCCLTLSYLAVFGVVERPAPKLEVPPLPPLEGARLLQQDPLLHTFLQRRQEEEKKRMLAHSSCTVKLHSQASGSVWTADRLQSNLCHHLVLFWR